MEENCIGSQSPQRTVVLEKGLGRPLYDLSSCSIIVLRCAADAKDENKEVCTAFNLFHMYLATSVLFFMNFY
jgi:hypothetical protein